MTKLASKLPKGDGNGLDSIARPLVENPHEMHVVIALIDCSKTTTDNDSGEVEPTARIRRVEVVAQDDLDAAEKLMRRALEKRTGNTVLPIDLEDEITEAFNNIAFDPETGEVTNDADGGSDD